MKEPKQKCSRWIVKENGVPVRAFLSEKEAEKEIDRRIDWYDPGNDGPYPPKYTIEVEIMEKYEDDNVKPRAIRKNQKENTIWVKKNGSVS